MEQSFQQDNLMFFKSISVGECIHEQSRVFVADDVATRDNRLGLDRRWQGALGGNISGWEGALGGCILLRLE